MRPSRMRKFVVPIFAAGIAGLAAYLLHRTLRNYSFEEISTSLQSFPATNLAAAAAFAAASYATLTLFDTLAVRYAGHWLPYRQTALASFTALSIGHNLGFAAVSSGAIRYRFYSRWGLSAGDVAKVILFCGLTVGLGLLTLGGAALLARPQLASEILQLPPALCLALGAGCAVTAAGYLALAGLVRGTVHIRGFELAMPDVRLALAQLVIGPANFAFVAACLYQTISAMEELPYISVATAYVIGNISALLSHVPGGLGVLEAVVAFLLPQTDLLAALIIFRFVYFLSPLVLGGLALALSELILGPRPLGPAEARQRRQKA